jgi:hypothetical protein
MKLEDLTPVRTGGDDRANDRDAVQDGLEIGSLTSLSAGKATNTSLPPRHSVP